MCSTIGLSPVSGLTRLCISSQIRRLAFASLSTGEIAAVIGDIYLNSFIAKEGCLSFIFTCKGQLGIPLTGALRKIRITLEYYGKLQQIQCI